MDNQRTKLIVASSNLSELAVSYPDLFYTTLQAFPKECLLKFGSGCLILNVDKNEGYKVFIVDAMKSVEAQYWKDGFLKVKPISNDFSLTKGFLSVTKEFVTSQLAEEFEINKTDQIDLLNRSIKYFKENESFNREDFEREVLKDREVINSFRRFDEGLNAKDSVIKFDGFAISTEAVTKQARIFKSVLKLDKNFHIYIHGDKNLIEKGIEKDGRKYYKIYYKEES